MMCAVLEVEETWFLGLRLAVTGSVLFRVPKTVNLDGTPVSKSLPAPLAASTHKACASSVCSSGSRLPHYCVIIIPWHLAGGQGRDWQAEGRASRGCLKISLRWKLNRIELFIGFYLGLEGNIWWFFCLFFSEKGEAFPGYRLSLKPIES